MPWRRGVALFLGLFAVYAFWAYPTVAPRDSADLAAAALTVSPAHAPGYPLYALLGKAWLVLMPWGDAAYRLNLLAAAAGAAAAAALFLRLAPSVGTWPGLGATLALAFSLPLWKFSLLCEMYSLHALFLAALLALAPGWPGERRAGRERRAALSALLLGLGLVNHQALILAVPGLAALWWRTTVSPLRPALLLLLGLALYAFLWFRPGDGAGAWALLTRKEYGTWQLSAGLSRPLDAVAAWGLLEHLAAGLWRTTSPLTLLLAAWGSLELAGRHRRLAAGLGLLFLAFGPGFFLVTRLDVEGWVARTVLETAMVAPALLVCAAAGFGLAAAGRLSRPAAVALALAASGLSLWRNGPEAFHRDDFCAYDYLKDLRRCLPSGAAAVAAGDTALYGMRYLDLVSPAGGRRRLIHYQDDLRGEAPRWVLGLALERAAALAPGGRLFPAGLAQTWDASARERPFWEVSVLRSGSALRRRESYARDVLLAYAFAHYVSGRLSRDQDRALAHFMKAAALDPDDYRIEYNSGHAQP